MAMKTRTRRTTNGLRGSKFTWAKLEAFPHYQRVREYLIVSGKISRADFAAAEQLARDDQPTMPAARMQQRRRRTVEQTIAE